MFSRWSRAIILLALLALLIPSLSSARNPYRRAFFDRYPDAENTQLDNLPSNSGHCGVCHFDFDGSGPRNPYGLAIEVRLAGGMSDDQAVADAESDDSDNDGVSIWVGGKVSNARTEPMFSKLAIPYLPNNPPRWPEATAVVKKILKTYKEDAKDWERINDWIERIGWPRFFEKTGLPFTKYHIDNWRGARNSLNASTHIHF